MQVRRITHCGRRVSINEQFVLRRFAHLEGYRWVEQRGEGEEFPRTTSPPSTLGATPPTPTIYPVPPEWAPTNLGDQHIGRPFQGDPAVGESGPERRPDHICSITHLTDPHKTQKTRKKQR